MKVHPDDTVYLTDLKLNLAKMRPGGEYYVSLEFYNDILFGDENDLPDYQGISILHRFYILRSFLSELHIIMKKEGGRLVQFYKQYVESDLIELRTE